MVAMQQEINKQQNLADDISSQISSSPDSDKQLGFGSED